MISFGLGLWQWVQVLCSLPFLYVASRCCYNLYLHPLARFPGPKRAAVSDWWFATHWLGGRWPFDLAELHQKYGPVVRIGPNDLAFISYQSVQDIFGHANFAKNRRPFLKDAEIYDPHGDNESIVAEIDPEKHGILRRDLSHAFSVKALREQSFVVERYADTLIGHLKVQGKRNEGIEFGEWALWLTFDIIGDLTFGQDFGLVAEARRNPQVDFLHNYMSFESLSCMTKRVPLLMLTIPFVLPRNFKTLSDQNLQLSREKLRARMAKDDTRIDFISHILASKRVEPTGNYLLSQAENIIGAGSESPAMTLSVAVYSLLKTPETLRRLCDEVRGSFSSTAAINGDSTRQLPYLCAVIEESLRLCPPLSFGLQRKSPGAMADGYYVPAGTTVSSSNLAAARSPDYFTDAVEFHPERWLSTYHPLYNVRYANDQKDNSKPFSIGPRSCIGMNLAEMEIRIAVAKLVWEFDWELINKDLDWDRDVRFNFMWTKPKLMVRFTQVPRE